MATQEAPAPGSTHEDEHEEGDLPPEVQRKIDQGVFTRADYLTVMSRRREPAETASSPDVPSPSEPISPTDEASADAQTTLSVEQESSEAHEEPGGQLRIPGLPEPPENPEHN